MLFNKELPNQPFTRWLWISRENKILLLICILVTTIEFIWFKQSYPYPNFFYDSFDYIVAAIENRSISYRPIGYSKFLQIVRLFTSSHVGLVVIQYVLLQLSILYFIFTINYFLSLNKWLFRISLLFCIAIPLVPHVSNLISSDALFTTLSLLWCSQQLWIIARPSRLLLLLNALTILFAFTVRYNALYYPLFSIAIISLSSATLKEKVASISFILVLVASFITFNMLQFKNLTGTAQFAPFSSWQRASNALAAYSHLEQWDKPNSLPPRFRKLHSLVNKDLDALHSIHYEHLASTFFYYMWIDKSPTYRYLDNKLKTNHYDLPDFKEWAAIAPFYADYGLWLIKKHPVLYMKYFIVPNVIKYYDPSLENIGEYNIIFNNLGHDVAYWFRVKSIYTSKRINHIKAIHNIANIHTIINLLLPFLLIGAIGCNILGKLNKKITNSVCSILLIWISNIVLNVISNPPVLRYLLFQMFITFILDTVLFDYIIKAFLYRAPSNCLRKYKY